MMMIKLIAYFRMAIFISADAGKCIFNIGERKLLSSLNAIYFRGFNSKATINRAKTDLYSMKMKISSLNH